MPGPLDYRFAWNNYDHPNLICGFDMSSLTPGGLLKNLAKSGAVYDATINGAPTYVPPLIRAKSTKAMSFGGVNEFLSLANPLNGLTNFTMIYWVNISSFAVERCIWSRATLAANYIFHYPSYAVGYLGGGITVVTPQALPINTVFCVAWVRDSTGKSTLYVNGKFASYINGFSAPAADANAFIGQYFDASRRLAGVLDNWMAYNIAFTPEQVVAHYRSSIPR